MPDARALAPQRQIADPPQRIVFAGGTFALLQLDLGALDESLPALDLGADGGHEGLRSAADGNDAVLGSGVRTPPGFSARHRARLFRRCHDLAGNALGPIMPCHRLKSTVG